MKRHRIVAPACWILTAALLPSPWVVAQQERGKQESEQTQTQPEVRQPLEIPAAERNRRNPIPASAESIESGENLYASQCAMCHGARGDGKGDLAGRLKVKIPDFTDPAVQKQRTDGEYLYITLKGHEPMPAETRLEPRELWDIINYIRTMSRGAPKK
jgi:mono/diheme cytochrome c family protein